MVRNPIRRDQQVLDAYGPSYCDQRNLGVQNQTHRQHPTLLAHGPSYREQPIILLTGWAHQRMKGWIQVLGSGTRGLGQRESYVLGKVHGLIPGAHSLKHWEKN